MVADAADGEARRSRQIWLGQTTHRATRSATSVSPQTRMRQEHSVQPLPPGLCTQEAHDLSSPPARNDRLGAGDSNGRIEHDESGKPDAPSALRTTRTIGLLATLRQDRCDAKPPVRFGRTGPVSPKRSRRLGRSPSRESACGGFCRSNLTRPCTLDRMLRTRLLRNSSWLFEFCC